MENTLIVGDGLVARAFRMSKLCNSIIFASGVSNSKTDNEADCARELILLDNVLKANKNDKLLVYFSTYSVYDSCLAETLYVRHKLAMENYIIDNCLNYLIVRTSNLVGNYFINSSTIFNYVHSSILNCLEFEVWMDSYRNFIDIDHFVLLVEAAIELKKDSGVITIVNPNDSSMLEIVNLMAQYLNVQPNYKLVNKGQKFLVDKSLSIELFQHLNIPFESYLSKLIMKYC